MRGHIADTGVVQLFQQGGVCGKTGDQRHQMRLTGAVVTDDQQALVVDRLVELHLRNDNQTQGNLLEILVEENLEIIQHHG